MTIADIPARVTDRLTALASSVRAQGGVRRDATAVTLGAVLTTALPPADLWPLVFVVFPILLWLIEGTGGIRAAFSLGWWFGVGFFAFGLYWISFSLLVDPWRYGWMIPFAVFGFSAGFAMFPALAAAALKATGARGAAAALIFAVTWTATEWLRGHVLTGFPWNLIATTWDGVPAIMQGAAVIGAYGLGLVTVALAGLPATLARGPLAPSPAPTSWLRWRATTLGAAILAVLWIAGAWRLAGADGGEVPRIRLRIVQPAVPQSLKWDPGLSEAHFRHLLELTRGPGWERATHIVWPETAVPFTLDNDARRRGAIAAVTPSGGLVITGAPRAAPGPAGIQVWNSLQAIDGSGAIVAGYDKFHLVPFGEYMPFRGLPLVETLAVTSIDFSAGPGPRTLVLPGLPPASPLICYEIIFPGAVVDWRQRPGWIINVTNDAWFGITAGPHQHFAAARFRAIEEGLPVVRAANNGISGVIDAYGRVTASLGLGSSGSVDIGLPRSLDATPYARFGDWVAVLLAMALLSVGAWLRARQ